MAITLNDNQFLTDLANMPILFRVYATNTSSEPQDFINSFATETLEYGDTKIYPFVDVPAVTDYAETSSLLTVTKPVVNEEAISISQTKVVKASYSTYILDMAFTDYAGMNNFVGYILSQMESAKISYIYDAIITDLYGKTFTKPTQTDTITLVNADGATSFSDAKAGLTLNQIRIATEIENLVNDMQVFTDKFNAKGYKQAITLNDMRLVMANPYKSQQVINLFAELLNSSYINENFQKPELLTIPRAKVPRGQNTVIGWLMHRYAYQWFYKFSFMGSFFDPSNLIINNFLHFWYGKGFLDNLPIVKLVANTPVTPYKEVNNA